MKLVRGRFSTLVDPRSRVTGLLLRGSPRFREAVPKRRSLQLSSLQRHSRLDEARPVAAWPTGRDSSLPASRYDYCVASATPLAAFPMSAATAFGWDT